MRAVARCRWAGLALDRVSGRRGMDSEGALLWLLGPMAAAAGAAPRTTGAALARGIRPAGRSALPLHVLGVVLPPAVAAGTLALGTATGRLDLSRLDAAEIGRQILAGLGPSAVKNLAEEATWRSVLTAGLVDAGWPDGRIDLLVGSTWGTWHLAYYAGFLHDDTVASVMGGSDRARLALVGTLATAAWAPLFTEVHRRTGTMWAPLVLHTTANSVLGALQAADGIRYAPGGRALFAPMLGAVPGALMLGAGLVMRRRRRRREGPLG